MDLKKKLYRSNKRRMIAGVCGGIGEYFDIDPILVRIVFLLLCLMGGSGVFFYIFCWIIIPKQGQENRNQEKARNFADELRERAIGFTGRDKTSGGLKRKKRGTPKGNIIGVLLVFFGFILLFDKVSAFSFLRWDLFWMAVIILIGFYLIFRRSSRK